MFQVFYMLLSLTVGSFVVFILRGIFSIVFSKEQTISDYVIEKHKDHDILGSFVGPHMIYTSTDLDLYQKVYIKEAHRQINRFFTAMPIKEMQDSLLMNENDNWRRSRRALASILTPSSLKQSHVPEEIAVLINKFHGFLEKSLKAAKNENEIKDCVRLFKTYSMAVILNLGYSSPDKIEFDDEFLEFGNLLETFTHKAHGPVIRWLFYIPSLKHIFFPLLSFFKYTQFCDILTERSSELLAQFMKEAKSNNQNDNSNSKKRRFMYDLANLCIQGRITKSEMIGNTLFMVLAGYETSGNVMATLFWELAQDQNVQDNLRMDIMKYGDQSKLLECCIKENLRLHSPANTARVISEDIEWKGRRLLKGTILALNTMAVHISQKIWGPDFKEFKPERFDDTSSHHPAQFVAFGLGPRNCVGYYLAMMEIKMLTASVLLKYRIVNGKETPKVLKLRTGDITFFTNNHRDDISLKFEPLII